MLKEGLARPVSVRAEFVGPKYVGKETNWIVKVRYEGVPEPVIFECKNYTVQDIGNFLEDNFSGIPVKIFSYRL